MIIVVTTLFFLLLVPYGLYESVQLGYFLHPFRSARPGFLSRDWYVTQTADPHPFFSSLVASFDSHHILPFSIFLIHVIQFFLLVAGIFRLSGVFSRDVRVPVLVSLFLLFYFSDGLGQSTLYSNIVQPTELAVPFYLFSIAYLLEKKIIRMWVFLGLSGLFHIHFAISGFLIAVTFLLFQSKGWSYKQLIMGFASFLAISGFNWFPILKNFSFQEPFYSPEIFKVFFNFRSPHHYRPSVFELSHAFRTLFPVFFILIGKRWIGKDDLLKPVKYYTAIVLGLCVLATVSTEWFYFPMVARLFFFRISPFLLLLGLIIFSLIAVKELDKKDLFGNLLVGITLVILFLEKDARLFIPLCLFLIFVWSLRSQNSWDSLKPRQKYASLDVILVVTSLFFLARGRFTELVFNAFLAFLLILLMKSKWKSLFSQLTLTFILFFIPAVGYHFIFPERIDFHPIEITPTPFLVKTNPALGETLDWIRSHTKPDALLLSPPYQDGIRFFAERAIVVDLHAHGYRARELKEWKERLETTTKTSGLEKWIPFTESNDPQNQLLKEGYLALTLEDVKTIGRRYGVDYFLTEVSYLERKKFLNHGHPLVFENSSYLVFGMKEGT